MQKAMAVENGVAQPGVAHPEIKAFVVRALGKPDSQGPFPDQSLVFADCCAQLTTDRLGVLAEQWQISMGGSAGQQVCNTLFLETREAADEVPVAVQPALPVASDGAFKMLSSLLQGFVSAWQQPEPVVQPLRKALLQILITEEREQCWRQPDGDFRLAPRGLDGLFQNLQKGQITLDQGLEEPILLQ